MGNGPTTYCSTEPRRRSDGASRSKSTGARPRPTSQVGCVIPVSIWALRATSFTRISTQYSLAESAAIKTSADNVAELATPESTHWTKKRLVADLEDELLQMLFDGLVCFLKAGIDTDDAATSDGNILPPVLGLQFSATLVVGCEVRL